MDYELEEELINTWAVCNYDYRDERYKNCEGCVFYTECLEIAQDNHDGYVMLEDSIVGQGYSSMDDFWECNGI